MAQTTLSRRLSPLSSPRPFFHHYCMSETYNRSNTLVSKTKNKRKYLKNIHMAQTTLSRRLGPLLASHPFFHRYCMRKT
jgi:hypothetical protein